MKNSLLLKNPHSVLAVMEHRPRDVLEISVGGGGKPTPAWQEVLDRARSLGIKVKKKSEEKNTDFNKPSQKFEREGGYGAFINPKESVSLRELFQPNEIQAGRLWIALDQVQDPHNMGAIFRTASFFGCEGLIIPEDRTASLTGTVYDVASGGVEALPFFLATNLIRALEEAKNEFDVWTIGSSEHAQNTLDKLPKDRNWILVLGNEEVGLREKVSETCDFLVSIPNHNHSKGVTSLNVSVAMGVFSFFLKNR